MALIRRVAEWGIEARRALFAAQDRIREVGPDAFELHAPYMAGVPRWDQLSAKCVADLMIQVGSTWLWVELEILPGKTVIFRRGRLE